MRKKEAQTFLKHVSVCLKCERTLRRLDWISKTIKETPEDFFPREELGPRKVGSELDSLWAAPLKMYAEGKHLKSREMGMKAFLKLLQKRSEHAAGKYNDQEAAENVASLILLAKYKEIPREREKFRGRYTPSKK